MKVSRGSELEGVLKYLAGRTGLTFPESRFQDVELGICKVMARYGTTGVGQFIQLINANPEAFEAVVVEITVGETYFFRDPTQLEAIRKTVLPSLLRIRPPASRIRVWTAGCATGEEAYSIAMLMEEEGIGDRVQMLGTDISVTALNKARKGEYGLWSFRNGQRKADARYFHRSGRRFQLVERIRSRARFDRLNLASDDYPSPANGTLGLDLILCRNVLIYLDRNTIDKVAQRLFASLADGGWLITGPSDPPLWDHAAFATVSTPGGVFYRREAQPDPSPAAKPTLQQGELGSPLTARSPQPLPAAETVPTLPVKPADAAPAVGSRWSRAATESRAGAEAAASRIREMANAESLDAAKDNAAEAVDRHPLVPELHFLHAMVLIALERQDEAEATLRRVIYLDRKLAAAHLALGSLFQMRGDLTAAHRSLATARALCAARPAAEPVPLTDGDTAGRLAECAEVQIGILDNRILAES